MGVSLAVDVECHGGVLLRLVDGGVSVVVACESLGIRADRGFAVLRVLGRSGAGRRTVITDVLRERVVAEFKESGNITGAGRSCGLRHDTARRILAAAGLVPAVRAVKRKVQAEARFTELMEAGWSITAAAREVGVDRRTGWDWHHGVRTVDGARVYPDGRVAGSGAASCYATTVTPPDEAVISERYLSLADRRAVADGLVNKHTLTAIAEGIGKNKSTVSREVAAHSVEGIYLPHHAHAAAAAARARPKTSKLVTEPVLRAQVEQWLATKLSPEQICNRLVKDFPDDESMRVSHETIYQALYFQARGGLKRKVTEALRTGRTRRKPHRDPEQRQSRFVDDMLMISERPADVEDRAVPGHWEGDLIMGQNNQTAIATLVERTTRYTLLVHLPDSHEAEPVRDGLIKAMQTLPQHLRGSLTWDQGCEMARHKQFTIATDMAVYFCDPHSPWQRGTNENTNGLLRQYFPKGTDLSIHGPEDLEHVAQELNARPRKTLDWDTPAERLRDLLTT